MMTTNEMVMYDQLVDMEIATTDEINLVFNCSTWSNWEECLNAILYSRTGYRSIAQYLEEWEEEVEDDDIERPDDFEEMRQDVERATAWMLKSINEE